MQDAYFQDDSLVKIDEYTMRDKIGAILEPIEKHNYLLLINSHLVENKQLEYGRSHFKNW